MEDGEATELVQQAIIRDPDATECVEMEGRDIAREGSLLSESNIRAFWRVYREMLGL